MSRTMNAKKEFLQFTADKPVKCAEISWDRYDDRPDSVLKMGYSESDLNQFLSELDFEYDNDFGGQELFGTIWFDDNTWGDRGEYDGSEWWVHNELPEIPERLIS